MLSDFAAGQVEWHRLFMMILIPLGGVAAVLVDKLEGGVSLWLAAALVIITNLVIWGIGEWRVSRVTEERLRARSETLVDLGYSLEPLIRDIGRTLKMKTARRRQMISGHRQAVLAAAANLGGAGARARACYFVLDPGDGIRPRRLHHDDGLSLGRADAPKAEFVAGTPEGDAALDMVDQGGYRFCDDVDQAPPPGWVPSARGAYKTFISVTVGVPGRPVGMLTLDAPEVGALVKEDVHMLVVLGHLLGIAEILAA